MGGMTKTPKITDGWVRGIKDRHTARQRQIEEERDAEIRQAVEAGYKQMEIVRLAEVGKETVRLALDPAAKEAHRAAQARRYAERTAAKKKTDE